VTFLPVQPEVTSQAGSEASGGGEDPNGTEGEPIKIGIEVGKFNITIKVEAKGRPAAFHRFRSQ